VILHLITSTSSTSTSTSTCSVANVRFNVAKTLQQIAAILPSTSKQAQDAQVRPVIEKLNTDSDFDVRYYASEAAMELGAKS